MKKKSTSLFLILFLFLVGCAAVGEDYGDTFRRDIVENLEAELNIDMTPELEVFPDFDAFDNSPEMEDINDSLFEIEGGAGDETGDGIDTIGIDTIDTTEIFERTEGLDRLDLTEDISIEDIPPDPGPGTCTPSDFPVQIQCNGANKCTLGASTGCTPTAICDVPGPQGNNQICTASGLSDNCMKGYVCLGDGAMNTCRKFCSTDLDCRSIGVNSGCQIQIATSSCPSGLTGVKTCTFHCDYFYQTGCQSGQACRFLIDSGRAYSDCTSAGTGRQGSPCPNGSSDCAPGYDCFLVDGTTQECLKICNYSGGYPTCDWGTTCSRGTDWPLPIGACI